MLHMKNTLFLIALTISFGLSACGPSADDLAASYKIAADLINQDNCTDAMPVLEDLVTSKSKATFEGTSDRIVSKSRELKSYCKNVSFTKTEIDEDPAGAFRSLFSAESNLKDDPKSEKIRSVIEAYWPEYSIADIADHQNCSSWSLSTKRLPDSETTAPRFLEHCANEILKKRPGFQQARKYLRTIVQDYPGAPNNISARESLAAATLEYAKNEADGFRLDAPKSKSAEGTAIGGDQAVISIANGTNTHLDFVIVGSETIVESVEPCTECEEGHKCAGGEPAKSIILKPGSYKIVLERNSVEDQLNQMFGGTGLNAPKPFIGDWTLEEGNIYPMCFSLQKSPY